jgi:sortase A
MTLRIGQAKFPQHARGWFLRRGAPLILFVIGISALSYCGYVVLDARLSQKAQSLQFDRAVEEARASNAAEGGSIPPVMPAFSEAGKATFNPASTNADEGIPLGRIEITAIGLTAMIQEGTGRQTLQRGVGHITGTAPLDESGNIGLAGHRDTFFRKLRNIHEGDEIKLTTLRDSLLYRVDMISIVEPGDSKVLSDSGGDVLTLVTCYPFSFVGPAPKRYIVRAHKMEPSMVQPSIADTPFKP